jgi:hypothetical protein
MVDFAERGQPSPPRLKPLCDRSPGFEKPGEDQPSLPRRGGVAAFFSMTIIRHYVAISAGEKDYESNRR